MVVIRNRLGQFIKGHTPITKGRRTRTKPCEICGKTIITYVNDRFCSHLCDGIAKRGKDYNSNFGIRCSAKYRNWRKTILKRDNFRCVFCGTTNKLEVDHIKPTKLYPELRYVDDNARTLCQECHQNRHRGSAVWKQPKELLMGVV